MPSRLPAVSFFSAVLLLIVGCGGAVPPANPTPYVAPVATCPEIGPQQAQLAATATPPSTGFFPGAQGEEDELNEDDVEPVPVDTQQKLFDPGHLPVQPASGVGENPAPQDIVTFAPVTTISASATLATAEPNVAVNGNRVLLTWNKLAAVSTDRGATFSYLDPTGDAEFASADGGFCCDQLAAYVAPLDLWLWVLQFKDGEDGRNRIRLAVAHGDTEFDAHSFHYWDFRPQDAGLAGGYDQTKLGLSTANAFLSINLAGADHKIRQAIVYRVDLAQLAQAGKLTPDCYLAKTDTGVSISSLRPVGQAATTMYLGAHVTSSKLGIWSWPDGASSPTFHGVTHEAAKGKADGVYHCPRAGDEADTDWCSRPGVGGGSANDERLTGAWLANGQIGFAWNARQDPPNFPYPWVDAVLVDESSMQVVGYPFIAFSDVAAQYATVMPNANGDLGGVVMLGGGQLDLTCAAIVRDKYTEPAEGAWSVAKAAYSSRAPLDTSGDYLGIWPDGGNDLTWSAGCMTQQTGTSPTAINFFRFGRRLNDPGD